MSDRPAIDISHLSPELRKKLGVPTPRHLSRLSQELIRSDAIRVLDTIANRTRAERARILKHALKVNKV